MRFKEWLLNEAGHFSFDDPATITISLRGQRVTLHDVTMIDPRFEFHQIPPAPGTENTNKLGKFVGDVDFALPLADGKWVNSQRMGGLAGKGSVGPKPVGYQIPDRDWAEKALIMGPDYEDLVGPLLAGAGDKRVPALAH
jgi:hypothetical protein